MEKEPGDQIRIGRSKLEANDQALNDAGEYPLIRVCDINKTVIMRK
jgi:hypothetical protein